MSGIESLYRENILDHYKHPRNKGRIGGAKMRGREANPVCGDEIEIFAKVGPGGKIEKVGFAGQGCAISQSAASMLTEMAKGRSVAQVMRMESREMLDELGVNPGPARAKCALLALKALKLAAFEYAGKAPDAKTRGL